MIEFKQIIGRGTRLFEGKDYFTIYDFVRAYEHEDELRALWSEPDTRKALLESLAERGFGGEQLREIERMIGAEKSDLYDVLAYIAFALSPITRQERVERRKPAIFSHYDAKLQTFLDFVLAQYVREGSASSIRPSYRTYLS